MRAIVLLLVLVVGSASAAPPAPRGILVVRGRSADLLRRGVETRLGPVQSIRCKDESLVLITKLKDRLRFFGRASGTTTCEYNYGGLLWHVDVTVVEPSVP